MGWIRKCKECESSNVIVDAYDGHKESELTMSVCLDCKSIMIDKKEDDLTPTKSIPRAGRRRSKHHEPRKMVVVITATIMHLKKIGIPEKFAHRLSLGRSIENLKEMDLEEMGEILRLTGEEDAFLLSKIYDSVVGGSTFHPEFLEVKEFTFSSDFSEGWQ